MIRILLCLAFVTLLGACASGSPNVVYKPESSARVRTVAIVLPPEPKKFSVVNRGHPGLAFALVGGIVVAVDQDRKESEFYQAMQFQKFSMNAVLGALVRDKLNAAGYDARVADSGWEEKGGRYVLNPGKIRTDADAVLVIVPTTAGFIAGGVTSDYVPAVTVAVRLLGKDRSTELYRGYHAAGWEPREDGWRFTPAARSFKDFYALMVKPSETAGALAQSIAAVAETIAQDLRRP